MMAGEMAGARAASGTWNGPPPRGSASFAPQQYVAKAAPDPDFDPAKEPREQLLPGGLRLPLLGCASSLASAGLAAGACHVRCGTSADPSLEAAGGAVRAFGREKAFVSAKLGASETSDPAAALDKLLGRLGLDAIELYSLEWPVAVDPKTGEVDASVKIEEVWAKMEALVAAGKCKALGLTNCGLVAVERVTRCAKVAKPLVCECELHPALSQRKLVGVCRRYGLALAAHTPLAGGDKRLLQHPALAQACASSGRSPEEVLLRWSVQRGVAAVVDESAGAEALARAAGGALAFRLTNAEKAALDAVEVRGQEVRTVEPPFAFEWDDPFLGGAARPGLNLEQKGTLV